MAVGSLRDDLLSLPGVEHAELEGDPLTPAGIRVRLSRGVDAAAIAGEVRTVLAHHGLRPEMAHARETAPSVTDPDEALTGERSEVSDEALPGRIADGRVVVLMAGVGPLFVGITEGSDTVVVTATCPTGRASIRASGSSVVAVDHAIVQAVAELAETATHPRVCSIDERELGGTAVVTVVLEERGERLVGSAIVRSGRAYAVGRAVWAALSSR